MPEIIRNWIVAITVAILIGAMLETLLPDSSIKKYVKLAIGLAIIVIILAPVVGFFNGQTDVGKELGAVFTKLEQESRQYEEKGLAQYKDYVYEVYMRNKKNKNE